MRSANQGLSAASRIIPILAALFLVSSLGAAPAVQGEAIKLDAPAFVWLDVIEDGATFEWSVDVVNNTNEAIRVRVFLDLRDDDDRSINRDDQGNPNDLVIITKGESDSRSEPNLQPIGDPARRIRKTGKNLSTDRRKI